MEQSLMVGLRISRGTADFAKNLEKLPGALQRNLKVARDRVGEHVEEETRKTILAQQFTSLSPVYKAWKIRHGFDSRILLRSHIMYHLIRYRRYQTSSNLIVGGVTVLNRIYPPINRLIKRPKKERIMKNFKSSKSMTSPKAVGVKTEKSVMSVAILHEDGLGGMPQRSFFRPTLARESAAIMNIFRMAIAEAMATLQ